VEREKAHLPFIFTAAALRLLSLKPAIGRAALMKIPLLHSLKLKRVVVNACVCCVFYMQQRHNTLVLLAFSIFDSLCLDYTFTESPKLH
jgi:hypothetical protein